MSPTHKEKNLLQKGQTVIKSLVSLACISYNYLDTRTQSAPQAEEEESNSSLLLTTLHLQLKFSNADLYYTHVYIAKITMLLSALLPSHTQGGASSG